ncbi:MAG: hypothetical protein H6Q94_562 [Nitrospirae bacterium]|jgi:hypothetical protein|nr:hypothetical protein [Nitrospirota bacterium]
MKSFKLIYIFFHIIFPDQMIIQRVVVKKRKIFYIYSEG